MPSVLGQVGQNVADNLAEIGQSAVKGAANVLTDVAHESIEQLSGNTPQGVGSSSSPKAPEGNSYSSSEQRKLEEKRRFQEVRTELEQYIQRRKQLDQRIAEERAQERQSVEQKKAVEKNKKESWVSRIINRSQTGTEKGRSSE